jgi:hypothetical protein
MLVVNITTQFTFIFAKELTMLDDIVDFGSEVEDGDEVILEDTLFFDEDEFDPVYETSMMFPNDEDGSELEDYIFDDD